MVKCPNCGKETDSSKKYCVHCGNEIKSNGKLKKILLVFLTLLICFLIINGAISYITSNNSNNEVKIIDNSQIESNKNISDSIESTNENSDSIESYEEDDSQDLSKIFSSSTKSLDFDGLFSMYIENDEQFRRYNEDQYGIDDAWVNDYYHDGSVDSENGIAVYYWHNENIDALSEEIIYSSSNMYFERGLEDNLVVLEWDDSSDSSHYYDYIVLVTSSDNQVVGLMGHDLEKIKNYAKSVEFS